MSKRCAGMRDIKDIRLEINEIDERMRELFESRMALAGEVAEYKMKNGLPIYDKEREDEVIRRRSAELSDASLLCFYEKFLHSVMDISKDYQNAIQKNG